MMVLRAVPGKTRRIGDMLCRDKLVLSDKVQRYIQARTSPTLHFPKFLFNTDIYYSPTISFYLFSSISL